MSEDDYGLGLRVHEDAYRELERERDEWKATQRENVQLKREVHRERALANEAIATWRKTKEERDEAREQRDRLAEALQRVRDGYGGQLASPNCCEDCDFLIPIDKALQSLTPKP